MEQLWSAAGRPLGELTAGSTSVSGDGSPRRARDRLAGMIKLNPIVACIVGALVCTVNVADAQVAGRGAAKSAQAPRTLAERRALLLDPSRSFWSTHAPDTV